MSNLIARRLGLSQLGFLWQPSSHTCCAVITCESLCGRKSLCMAASPLAVPQVVASRSGLRRAPVIPLPTRSNTSKPVCGPVPTVNSSPAARSAPRSFR